MSKVVVTLEFGSLGEMFEAFKEPSFLNPVVNVLNQSGEVLRPGDVVANLGTELQEDQDAAAAAGAEPPPPPPPGDEPPPPPPPGDEPPPVVDPDRELDEDGIPWDARIHASTKSKVKAGTWKKKPKVDPALFAKITAELKASVPPSTVEQPAAPPPPVPPANSDDTKTADAPITTFFELTGLFNAYGYDLEAQNKFIKENFDMPSIAAVAVKAKSDHDLVPGIADVVRAMPRPA